MKFVRLETESGHLFVNPAHVTMVEEIPDRPEIRRSPRSYVTVVGGGHLNINEQMDYVVEKLEARRFAGPDITDFEVLFSRTENLRFTNVEARDLLPLVPVKKVPDVMRALGFIPKTVRDAETGKAIKGWARYPAKS